MVFSTWCGKITAVLNIVEASRLSQDTTASTNGNSNALDLDLKKIVLKNMNVTFLDRLNSQQVVSHIDKIQSSFINDSEQIYSDLPGALVVDYIWPGDSSLFRHKHLNADLRLSYERRAKCLKSNCVN